MAGQVKTLLIGNSLAQGLQFASLLVLSRIYLPVDFGLLAEVQSLATVAVIVATLQLHLSIPLCKSTEDARATTEAVQAICVAVVAIALPIALFVGAVFVFAVFLTLLLGLTNTYTSYLVFSGSFGQLSRFYVARAVFIIALQLVLAVLSVSSGLLWGAVVGEGIAAAYLRISALGLTRDNKIDLAAVLRMIRQRRAFSFFGTLQELISVSAFYTPLLLFVSWFGQSIGGQYAMANRLVWAPAVLLSSSLAQVLYHRYGRLAGGDLGLPRQLLLHRSVVFSALAICGLSFLLEDVFLLALGPQWHLASRLIPLNMLWGSFFLLSTPFRVMCRVMHLQKYQLVIDTVTLAAIALLFVFLGFEPLYTMWGILLITIAQHTTLSAVVWRTLDRRATNATASTR